LSKLIKEYSTTLVPGKKIYFASDTHFGLYPIEKSRIREKLFVRWLDSIKEDAQEIFLLGDIFDFWYEYKKVVPRGFTRFIGKLAELHDSGIKIHFFTGNHDVWVFDYLPQETGAIIYRKPLVANISGKKFFLAHGDGLGSMDIGYKFLKACFVNPVLQFLFSRLHPNLAMLFGQTWSKHSRYSKGIAESFMGEDKEHLIAFAKQELQKQHFDYFVFGHRHLALDYKIADDSHIINLGEWIHANTYAVFDGLNMELKKFE
jgi:UDP-2,3-diacylglucosamine hydrolase